MVLNCVPASEHVVDFSPLSLTGLLCSVLNNTPIVALLIPIMIAWGRRAGVSPKKLLIPLAYAAVFGGTLTLIGTSTNLVISSDALLGPQTIETLLAPMVTQ